MTKKDYVRLVEDLGTAMEAARERGVPPTAAAQTVAEVAKAFANTERRQNARFDVERFFTAVSAATGVEPRAF